MICPFCKEASAASCVTPGMTSSTCMASSPGHYDETGQWVRHRDPNWHTTMYFCSRGHRWSVMSREGDEDVVTHISTMTWTQTHPERAPVPAVDTSRSSPHDVAAVDVTEPTL